MKTLKINLLNRSSYPFRNVQKGIGIIITIFCLVWLIAHIQGLTITEFKYFIIIFLSGFIHLNLGYGGGVFNWFGKAFLILSNDGIREKKYQFKHERTVMEFDDVQKIDIRLFEVVFHLKNGEDFSWNLAYLSDENLVQVKSCLNGFTPSA